MLTDWQQGESPLFAFAPAGDDSQWSEIEAFDQFGNIHYLSVDQMPTQPVFIVELDQQKVQDAGIAVMKGILSANKFRKNMVSPQNQLNNDEIIKNSLMDFYAEWKGVKYKLGGASKSGIDCSAFTQRIYKEKFDIKIPRSTRTQVKVGKKVAKSDL